MMNYDRYLNHTLTRMKPSGIRKFFSLVEEMDNPNMITLAVGEPDFKTPWHIRQASYNFQEKGYIRYTSNAGLLELRQEIAKYYKRKFHVEYDGKTEALVTVGGSEGIDMAIRSLINPGDEALIVEPSFVCYKPIVEISGGIATPIVTKQENEFRLMPDELENAISDKTKLLILPYPNNPTGGIMSAQDLENIREIIIKHDLIVLSDEIYSELTYSDEGHTSIASLEGMRERCVVINGFSKSYSMTGWRLGYALGPEPIIRQMTKMHQFAIMSSPTISQHAAVEALRNGDEDIERMKREYNMRRRLVVDGFRKIGLECFEPRGAFYVFPCIKSTGLSSEEFAEKLLESKLVAVVPGNAFGDCGEGFIRVSYCYSIQALKEALVRIEEFIKELKHEN